MSILLVMMNMEFGSWKLGEDFQPAPQFRTLYFIYLALLVIVGILIGILPAYLFGPPILSLIFVISFLAVVFFTVYWIPKYYGTIRYKLDQEEVEWHRGVWFKNTGIVPYNRITNVDISQGPISRFLGIGTVKIQTAGYSNPNQAWGNPSEITIQGVVEFESLRNILIGFVRGRKPLAVQTFPEEPGDGNQILEELVEIKELLREITKK
ncbi:PH domain-containing protein [Methanobacterium sp. CWC-01]|jgi:hypothetical protein|nr:PH domain-containing protein [Methanobacterium sp. CWC-01]